MMTISQVVACPATTGFYSDDQDAIRLGAVRDGFLYDGDPVTRGFVHVRQPGEAVSVLIVLSDGQVAHGDCASVQYSGVGGRAAVFRAADGIAAVERLAAGLIGEPLDDFRRLDALVTRRAADAHPAVLYGVTQALLHAVALARGLTIAEQVQSEYAITVPLRAVPIFAQSGDDRHDHVDKMILREVNVLPHGLINSVDKIGPDGEFLRAYVRWVVGRVLSRRARRSYEPVIHIDVYGLLGLLHDGDLGRVALAISQLGEDAAPLRLRVEGPIDLGSRDAQIVGLAELRRRLRALDCPVEIVADEWCNDLVDVIDFVAAGAADMIQIKTPDLGSVGATIEALLHCRAHGVGAYSGGTCNETDRSAQISTQIAMACGADQTLAKPGMGVDEGYMIVRNEMNRVVALTSARAGAVPA